MRRGPFTAPGGPTDPLVLGGLIKRYTYDGRGRLVQTESPRPDAATANAAATNMPLRVERFYYDGIRRVQEVVQDVAAPDGNGARLAEAAWLEREYIWGPGDGAGGPGGVDELLAQFDGSDTEGQGKPWWTLQDAGGDLVALCETPAPISGVPQPAAVAAQWSYDAYGAALTAEHLRAHPFVSVGHKGLFFDRLDVGVADSAAAGAPPLPRLVPFAHAVYHMRNRVYAPSLGRFLQRDPNATAQTLMSVASHSGRTLASLSVAFSIDDLYGDGGNLYEYIGSNPWTRSDVLGLSWDPFDFVEEFALESAMERAAFMEQVGMGATAAAYIGLTIVGLLPFPITAVAADLGASALEGRVPPELVMAGKVLGYLSLASVARSIAKGAIHGARVAARYVMKHGVWGTLKNGHHALQGLMHRGKDWVMRKLGIIKACGCFTGSTIVWTASGLTPIEDVRRGDLVLAWNDASGESEYREVTNTFESLAALLDLQLRHADGRVETIRTTDEHPFMVRSGYGNQRINNGDWVRADQLSPGDEVETLAGTALILSQSFTGDRRVVYNLTAEGLRNYRVGPSGVLVHNCNAGRHHLFPKYLGGEEDGILRFANKQMHNDIHNFINEAGKRLGIPTKQKGKKAVERWYDDLASKPGGDPDALLVDALTEAYTKFDLKYGTSWTALLHTQLRKQGIMP